MKYLTKLEIYELALKQLNEKHLYHVRNNTCYKEKNNYSWDNMTDKVKSIINKLLELEKEIEKLQNRQNGQKNKGN